MKKHARVLFRFEFLLVLALSFILVFGILFHHLKPDETFEPYDDLRNQEISLTTKATLRNIFDFTHMAGDRWVDSYYMPFHWLIHYVVNNYFDSKPYAFRIFIYIIFALNGALIYYLAKWMLGTRYLSFLALIYFIGSRQMIQGVMWLSAAVHGLSTLFMSICVAAYFFFLKRKKNYLYAVACLGFAFAWLSKQTAASLPAILVITDFYVTFDRKKRVKWVHALKKWFLTSWRRLTPFVILEAIFLGINLQRYPGSLVHEGFGGIQVGANCFYKWLEFVYLLTVPIKAPPHLSIYVFYLIFMAIIAVFCWGKSKERFLLAWLLVTLLPFLPSNFRPVDSLTRYLYAASIPFCLLLVQCVMRLSQHKRVTAWIFGAFILCGTLLNLYLMYQHDFSPFWRFSLG